MTPADARALLALAEAYTERGEGIRALPVLEKVLAARPADEEALRGAVGLLRDDGNERHVQETVQRAVGAELPDTMARELLRREGRREAWRRWWLGLGLR